MLRGGLRVGGGGEKQIIRNIEGSNQKIVSQLNQHVYETYKTACRLELLLLHKFVVIRTFFPSIL